MRLAQISDFHFTHLTWNPFRLFSKRILGNLNWLFNRKGQFSEKAVHALPPLFKELGVDLALLGGDFTTTALKEEFVKATKFVEKIKQPWLAIPGNHDHYTKESFRGKHYYRYLTNRQRPALEEFTLKDDGLEAHRIGDGWWVITLDTSRATSPTSSRGLVSEALEGRLEKALKAIPPNESVILMNHYPFFQHDLPSRTLERGEALEQLLKRHPRIRIYLHGHTHRHTLADLQASRLPLILDSGSCAQMNHATWNLIDLEENGCSVHVYEWKDGWQKQKTQKVQWQSP